MSSYNKTAVGSELGQKSGYDENYNPGRLYAIPRSAKRDEIGVDSSHLPFLGFDCWNHYEVSWLNQKGKPMVAMATIMYDCTSEFIIESKSMKLYFNSINNTCFDSLSVVELTIKNDLDAILQTDVDVRLMPLNKVKPLMLQTQMDGESIDDLDIACDTYTISPEFLSASDEAVEEVLTSDLLKSNCLVTHQPDWGSVQIAYKGKRIDREGLLKYLVSFRNHDEFHEQCIERIFVDIMNSCKPEQLTVYGRYTRRGGLDINPYRSTQPHNRAALSRLRCARQ